jgi:hypothetical protein
MGHPAIDEMQRVAFPSQIRNSVWMRWRRQLRDEVNPVWDQYGPLQQALADLKGRYAADVADLTAQILDLKQIGGARQVRRRGRPPKARPAAQNGAASLG